MLQANELSLLPIDSEDLETQRRRTKVIARDAAWNYGVRIPEMAPVGSPTVVHSARFGGIKIHEGEY